MIPAVFIHYGNHDYFKTVVEHARLLADVHVIGDSASTQTHDIRTYYPAADEFSSLYEHLSTNGREVELMCFKRWFMLLKHMSDTGTDVCLYLDSDVLLFTNPISAYDPFHQFDFTLVHGTSGHTSYWTKPGLAGFCDFLLKTYKDKSSYDYDKISSHYHVRRKHGLPGGVCDMTLLSYYASKRSGAVGEMMHIFDGWTFDHNINEADQGFQMEGGRKHVTFIQSGNGPKPVCMLNGKPILFGTLHCQGPAKSAIGTLAKRACP